jgi:transposase
MGETIPIQGREITLEDIRLIQQLIDANPSWNRTRLSQELCLLWNWRAANGQMKIFREYSQSQGFLLPPSLDEFVPENHEARIINDVVDTMDLSPLLAKYEGGGAPAYHPAMMLKVIIYAYSRDIYSSRSIAQGLKADTAFMFLSGLQSPDFRTICLFRAEHADVLPDLYVEVVRLCASLGMVGLGHIAFDGTKLKANASVRQTRDRDG